MDQKLLRRVQAGAALMVALAYFLPWAGVLSPFGSIQLRGLYVDYAWLLLLLALIHLITQFAKPNREALAIPDSWVPGLHRPAGNTIPDGRVPDLVRRTVCVFSPPIFRKQLRECFWHRTKLGGSLGFRLRILDRHIWSCGARRCGRPGGPAGKSLCPCRYRNWHRNFRHRFFHLSNPSEDTHEHHFHQC